VLFGFSWTTRIELPLKEEQASKDMAKKFDDVQPSLLLFLHRLRKEICHSQNRCKLIKAH